MTATTEPTDQFGDVTAAGAGSTHPGPGQS